MRPFLPLSHLSWPVQASVVCGTFLLVGLVIVDDYGGGADTPKDRIMAARNLAFITGAADRLDGYNHEHDTYYSVVFDLPLLLIERGLGLADSRSHYLLQHLVTHGFFLVGGFCCSLLVYRLSHSRVVALLALLLFLLQPRLYAHSFFNSRDLPFLSMFMVTLYVTHRAFRTETVGAFVLCGVCVGLLTNLRIMGVMLYPAVLALRGLDLGQAGRGARPHVLVTGAVFALAGPCTLYVLSPYLWADPFAFVTAWQALAHIHHTADTELFQGRLVSAYHLPPHYIPTWVAISTPLVTLLCSALGVIRVGLCSALRPREALGNTDVRFGLLLVACVTLPVVAIIVLGSHLYSGWRHVFFLQAPLCGLAGLGLKWAGEMGRQVAPGVYALVGVGVLMTGVEMVRLHPHQQVYFNELVDRTTPEYLRNHYVLDPWRISCREGLEFLRRRYPATTVYVQHSHSVELGWATFPQADRARLVLIRNDDAGDFRIGCGIHLQTEERLLFAEAIVEDPVFVRRIYNSTLLTVTGLVTVPDRSRSTAHRVENTYRGATSGKLVSKATFDLYTYPGTRMLGYARSSCTVPDTRPWFFVHVYPVDTEKLPWHRRRHGFDNLDFHFSARSWKVAGQCWASRALPEYEIARIVTGQYDERGRLWETELVGPIP